MENIYLPFFEITGGSGASAGGVTGGTGAGAFGGGVRDGACGGGGACAGGGTSTLMAYSKLQSPHLLLSYFC